MIPGREQSSGPATTSRRTLLAAGAVTTAITRLDRDRLTAWLLNNTTSAARFRAGLPATWTIADKTGSGDYGNANDVGIAWTEAGAPVVLAVLTTKPTLPDGP